MIRRAAAVVLVPLAIVALPIAGADGKKRAKCARYFEKAGCKLKQGEQYIAKNKGGIDILREGFNVQDLIVKSGACEDGTTAAWVFDIGTAESAIDKAVKTGKSYTFTDEATYILNGQDEVPVTLQGTASFTAKSARLTGTSTAKLPTGGPAKTCTAQVDLKMPRAKTAL